MNRFKFDYFILKYVKLRLSFEVLLIAVIFVMSRDKSDDQIQELALTTAIKIFIYFAGKWSGHCP